MGTKRKRPAAQDWPPISQKKKTLIPYGHRPKLPRMNESPYIDLWLRVMSFVRQAEQKQLKRAIYFRDLHSELQRIVPVFRDCCVRQGNFDKFFCPIQLVRKTRIPIRGLRVFRSRTRTSLAKEFYLKWVPYIPDESVQEKLVWVTNKYMLHNRDVTNLRQFSITRYKKVDTWKRGIDSNVELSYSSPPDPYLARCPICGRRHKKIYHKHHIRALLERAPKCMYRFGSLSVIRKIYAKYGVEIEE